MSNKRDDDVPKLTYAEMASAMTEKFIFVRDRNGVFHRFDDGVWREETDATMWTHAIEFDAEHHRSPSRVKGTVFTLGTMVQQHQDIEWNASIGYDEVPCANGILNVVTGGIREPKPNDWLTNRLPHAWDEDAECPGWHEAMNEVWQLADDTQAAMQEFFGYTLLSHARYKKAALFYGPKADSGKSQMGHMLRMLVGTDQATSLDIAHLGDPRQIAPIVNKRVNIMSEIASNVFADDAGFKRLVSDGDAVQIDPKHKTPFLYVPYCKHVFLTNHLPRTKDDSDAFFKRMLIIPLLTVVPKEKQDPLFREKMEAELPGILRWAVEGATRLIANRGRFTEIESAKSIMQSYVTDQNPVLQFLMENYEPAPDDKPTLIAEDVRNRFWDYTGLKKISASRFGRYLSQAGFAPVPRNGVRYIPGWKKPDYSETSPI